jgi:hypothetical protein
VLAGILLVVSMPLAAWQFPTGVPGFTVCYNYGCKHMDRVSLTPAEWNEVLAVFSTAADSAQQERQQIRQAVALMEQFVGRHTPTYRDRGRNPPTDAWPGQMDCIDESVNTTSYLRLFETFGGLRWHRVSGRVVRSPYLFDLHWAGQLVERATQSTPGTWITVAYPIYRPSRRGRVNVRLNRLQQVYLMIADEGALYGIKRS